MLVEDSRIVLHKWEPILNNGDSFLGIKQGLKLFIKLEVVDKKGDTKLQISTID